MNIRGFLDRLMGRAVGVRSAAWDAAGSGNRLANWNAQPAAVNAWVDNPVMVRARRRASSETTHGAERC